jgi:Alcohol dehydrogenase GroES-like domain
MTICVRAVAVNPVDAIPGLAYRLIMPWLTFPAIIGGDVAGEVVEAGPGVTRLQPGDRVLGMADGLERSRNNAAEAPSRRTPSSCRTWSRPSPTSCPSNKPPCCPSRSRPRRPACSSETTSRCPSRPSTRPTASRRYWYGAARPTSVATASSSPAAPDTASSPRHPRATSATSAHSAPRQRSTTTVAPPSTRSSIRWTTARSPARSRSAPDPSRRPFQSHPKCPPGIYADFLPAALASGAYRAAPDALVVGDGLEQIPRALDQLRMGVSASKLVVRV